MSVATMPLVGKKFQAKLGGMANEAVASGVSSFAKRQMEKMGWTEGKGLGKDEQGMATHIKVKRREENAGVGVETKEKEDQTNQWWYNVYNNVASKIVVDASDDDDDAAAKAKKAKKKAKKELKRKRDADNPIDEPTDEQLFAATGGKMFGRRAYGSCKGKLLRDAIQTGKVVTDTVGDSKKRAKKSKKDKKSSKQESSADDDVAA
ncbi:hypothetical protein H257_06576 [Aphanomyces astaci]|uniref:G-patch domain-containing protein n=1 Tax=Aphanomyces astaci TaxID=112090 RepID=W4GKL0_APHAT|nr:hypothetical protein H257_06576 [Aphanomyces astaci]ETV80230.1 hypothetical protein H257_06576 [Aphanomyces astaci]RHY08216.1 hypothetical protein DYB36_001158 [Aphanomyces astaci]RHY16495.1 hypothetical protein DYB25_000537 [Aphanomyces astaci]RHY57763.1 hypothetical protein DYB30_001604 [Aphanomyces astaci]RHY92549.1 hypothetical protein DYB35_000348 [Aphanomyces astaci]|eukprot:XP_009830154.1 hypothetical protein H257_06576 [Aphanomyces astaci]